MSDTNDTNSGGEPAAHAMQAADAQSVATEQAAVIDAAHPDTAAIASLAGGLAERGLAPDGDYPIIATTLGLIDTLQSRSDRLDEELKAAREELEAAKADAEKAATAPKTARGKASGRKCGPLKGEPLAGAELLELIGAAETVEVLFSNGKTEVAGIAPLTVSGNAWKLTAAGMQLDLPELMVSGPDRSGSPAELKGYGLMLDGTLVAYRERFEPLVLIPGSNINLAQDVLF